MSNNNSYASFNKHINKSPTLTHFKYKIAKQFLSQFSRQNSLKCIPTFSLHSKWCVFQTLCLGWGTVNLWGGHNLKITTHSMPPLTPDPVTLSPVGLLSLTTITHSPQSLAFSLSPFLLWYFLSETRTDLNTSQPPFSLEDSF